MKIQDIPKFLKENLYIAIIAFIVWAGYGGYVVVQHVNRTLDATTQFFVTSKEAVSDTSTAMKSVNVVAQNVNATVTELNKPVGGTLPMLNEDVGAFKSLIIHADLVARHEQQQLTTYDDQEVVIFNNVNNSTKALAAFLESGKTTTDAATGTLNAATDSIKATKPAIQSVTAFADAGTKTVQNANASVTNLNTVSGNAAKVTTHFEQKIDHPAPKTFWQKITDGWQLLYQLALLAATIAK